MAQTVKLPDGQTVSFPDDVSADEIDSVLNQDFPQFAPKPTAESGIIGTLGGGAAQTGRAVGAALDLAQNDLPELQAAAAEQAARVKDPRLAAFEADLAQRRSKLGADPGWLDVIGEVGSAAWKNPAGAGLMAVDQLPNSAAVLAGAGAGAMAGSAVGPAGTAAGGIIGGLAGMYAGNLAVEGGNRALEHVGKTGDLSSEDRSRLIYEGAIKAGVITGVDAATFGMTKFLTNAARRAVETATLRVAEQAGVTTAAEIAARRAADPVFDSAVVAAQKLAMDGATTFGKRALQTGAALGLETIGEGLGEYLGEFAATGEADKMDAVIEAFSSLGQSAAEVGIAKVWNSRNPIAAISAAPTNDAAIAAAEAALAAPIEPLETNVNEWKAGSTDDTLYVAPTGEVMSDAQLPAYDSYQQAAAPVTNAPLIDAAAQQAQAQLSTVQADEGTTDIETMRPKTILKRATSSIGTDELRSILTNPELSAVTARAVHTELAARDRAATPTAEGTGGTNELRTTMGGTTLTVPNAAPAKTNTLAEAVAILRTPVEQRVPADAMRLRNVAARVGPEVMGRIEQLVKGPALLTREERVATERLIVSDGRTAPAAKAVPPTLPAPTTQQQLADNEAGLFSQPRKSVFGASSQLRSEAGPDIKGEKVTRNMRKVLVLMGRITGTKVVFEYAPGNSDGAVPNRAENTIHINTAAQINPMQVMGHEVTHVLRDRHTAAWGKVRDALVATMPDKRKALDDFAANYWGVGDESAEKLAAARAIPDWSAQLTPEQKTQFGTSENTVEAFLLDEMVSDLGGQHWSSEKFWLDVFAKIEKAEGDKARGIIERLVMSIRETLTKFIAVVRAQKQDDYATVSVEQLEKTRDAITTAYAQFIRAERRVEPDGEPHVTDHRIGTSDTHSRSSGAESELQPAAPAVPAATGDGDELSDARSRELASLSPSRPEREQRLFFEVAPNPNDAAATAAWQKRTDAEKQAVSNDVVKRIIPGLLADIGVTGEVVTQLGGWKQYTNPSFALVVSKGDPALAARAIGYVLDQEAVYALGLKSFTGGTKTGIIHFDIGRKDAHNIYKQVRDLARGIITGHSTVDGEMLIGLPMADMQRLRPAVEAVARKADIAVNFDSGYGAIIKEYGYGLQFGQQNSRQQHPTARDVNQWRTEAREVFGQRSDAASGGSDRAVSRSEARPSYGKAIDQHAGTVTGVHYSNAKRTELNSEFYGTGYRGAERARIASATDPRIKRRVYFYTNNGNGINPESGVGYHAHSVDLNNMYDGDSDPLKLHDGDANKFESAVIDAGYDGYYTRNFGKNGAAVLLGAHAVPVAYEGLGARPDVPRMSEMRPVDTSSAAFKQWFGDSKVIDANGKPLKVYHGTNRDVLSFDTTKRGSEGSFFAEDPLDASLFASEQWHNKRGSPNIIPVYLVIEKPAAMSDIAAINKDGLKSAKQLRSALIAKGFDGIIKPHEIIAFYPTQIKSAISNTGEFSRTDPRIQYSQSRPPAWWYSPLARQADAATMKKAPASGWKSWLKSLAAKGVKPDEIKWSGIEEWLDVQGEATVTREQVQAYLSEFGVRIETILRGERNPVRPVTDTDQEVEDEDVDIELNVGDWQTDDPDEAHLADRASERFDEVVDERVDETWDYIADDIQREATAQIAVAWPDIAADVRREMGDMFPVDDELVEQVARNYAAAQVAGSTWQEYTDDSNDMTDEAVQTEAVERAFAVLSGDMEALETEARRRARAEIDEDTLLEELIEQERTWYYDDYDSPQTRGITVDGVDGTFWDSQSYGERQVYYDGRELTLPRNADDADVEGAIRNYVMEEGLIAGRSGDAGGYRAVKWEGYTTDKSRAVPGSYREVQLTLPVGAFGMPKTRVREEAALNYYDDKGDLIGTTINEDRAKERADNMGGRVEPASPVQTERMSVTDFYYTTHWSEADVIGFARWDEHRDADDARIMVIQEVQGDWGQTRRRIRLAQAALPAATEAAGEAQGAYSDAVTALESVLPDTGVWKKSDWLDVARGRVDTGGMTKEQLAAVKSLQSAYAEKEKTAGKLREIEGDANEEMPNEAPFVDKTAQWTSLVMRRLIAHAIEYGFDKVVWTSGAQQVERWKGLMRKQVDTIAWEKTEDGIHVIASYQGKERANTKLKENALTDHIGKLMAQQIINDPNQSGEITGDDITISDVAMAESYDRMLPNFVNEILKKADVRVKDIEVHPAVEYGVQDLSKQGGAGYGIVGRNRTFAGSQTYDTRDAAEAKAEAMNAADAATAITTQQGFEITDKLRESAAAGMPLFSQRRASAEARKSEARKEWYRSQLSEAVGGLPAKIKTGKEAALWLTSNAGKLQVKKDELTWSGVLDWLQAQGKQPVTGAQIQDWLASNGVRVRDVMLGEESPEYKRLNDELRAIDDEISKLRTRAVNILPMSRGVLPLDEIRGAAAGDKASSRVLANQFSGDALDAMLAYGKALNRKNELFDLRKAARGETPKHDSSSLRIPGGKPGTYRELLLVLPHTDMGTLAPQRRAVLKQMDELRNGRLPEDMLADENSRLDAMLVEYDKLKYKEPFKSSHYPQPNILSHLRFEEMIDADGKRVMFIQEVQSDWGQKGRKEGFAGTERTAYQVVVDGNPAGAYESMAEAEAAKQRALKYNAPEKVEIRQVRGKVQDIKGVSTAPFVQDTKSWVSLALKRAISHAVDNGFDRVAWTTGEQQNDRYSLDKQVSEISWRVRRGNKNVTVELKGGDQLTFHLTADNRVERIDGTGETTYVGKPLDEVIGKEVTAKIIAADDGRLAGDGLKIGGEGMVAFYDGIVKQVARSLGATVGEVSLPNPYRPSSSGMTMAEADANLKKAEAAWKPTQAQPGFDITDKMREQAAVGMPLFSTARKPADNLQSWLGKSVVRGVMYHGTSRDISEFRPKQADAIFLTDDPKFAADFADLSHSWMLNNYWLWMTPEQIAAMKRTAMDLLLQDTIPGSPLYLRETRYMDSSHTTGQYTRRAVELFMPSESNIMPLYVRAENPFDYRNPEHVKAIEDVLGGSWMGNEFINGEMVEVAQHIGDLERGDWNAIESQQVQDYIRANHDSFYVRERGVTNLAVFSPNQVKSASGNTGAYSREDNDIRRSETRPTTPKELRAWAEKKAVTDPTYDMQVVVPADEGTTGEKYDDGNPFKVIDGGGNEYGTFATRKAADKFILEELEGRTYIARQSTPRSRLTGQPINQTWPDPDMTDWDDFVRKMQDKMVDTKRVIRAIREAGVAISERFDPYMQEILYHGRAASRVKNFADTELRQLLEDMSMRGVVMQDLDDYLWARHAPERNAANARSNSAITDGSGMTDAQSADILAGRAVTLNGRTIQLSQQTLRGAAALANRVDAINNRTLDLLVEYKLETQATVDTWKRTYAHYAPLKRDMESDANYSGAFNLGLGIGQGFSVRGPASRRALGSKRSVVDILANIAMQRERAIVRGEKNRVAQAVYGLALTAPNPEFWIPVNPELNRGLSPAALAKLVAELVSIGVNPLDAQNIAREPVERYIDPKTGLQAERINPRLRNRDDVLSVRINGEDRYVMFSNKERAQRMVAGLKNLDADQLGAFLQASAIGTRWFASVNTQFNPIFGITNGLRDLSTGMLNLSSTPLSANRAEIARNAFSALKGIYLDLRDHRAGRAPTSQWAQLFEQFALDGGQTGYRDMFQDSKARADEIAKELKHAGKGKQWVAGGEKHSAVFGWLSDYNTAVENAVRLSAYKAALDKGMTRPAAAALAKNLTVNFNKKGLAATQTGALYAFFNAAVQGTARMAETMTTDGKLNTIGQKIVYGGIVLGVIQATLGMLAGWDDEEPPQYLREKNFLIPDLLFGSDKYLSVPMPLGFHVIPSVGRIATEWMMSGFKDPGKRLVRLVSVVLDAFNPVGGNSSVGQMLSPTITDPIIALGENQDWTGKPIYKEDFSKMQPTPGWTRTKDAASPPSRWLAYALNYATGGGKYEIGIASPTPDQIDYLVGQATGGVGRELLKTAQYVGAKATGEEMPLYKTPLGVGRFVGETKGQASETSRFYDNLRRIGEHKSALEAMKDAGDRDALLRYTEKHPDARLVQTADKAQREIGYLRRQKRELIEKGASKERVRIVEDRITGLTRRYNEVLRGR